MCLHLGCIIFFVAVSADTLGNPALGFSYIRNPETQLSSSLFIYLLIRYWSVCFFKKMYLTFLQELSVFVFFFVLFFFFLFSQNSDVLGYTVRIFKGE